MIPCSPRKEDDTNPYVKHLSERKKILLNFYGEVKEKEFIKLTIFSYTPLVSPIKMHLYNDIEILKSILLPNILLIGVHVLMFKIFQTMFFEMRSSKQLFVVLHCKRSLIQVQTNFLSKVPEI